MARSDGTVLIDTRVDTRGVNSGMKNVEGALSRVGGAFKKLGGVIAAAFAVKAVVNFSKECIALGSDLEEVQNVVDVTFGKMSGAIEQFSKEAATQFGISELAAKQYTSTIGAMYKSMGFSEQAAADMSIEMTKLAADMASFYNLDADEAFGKIRSGISGETEPLKQLGINLSEANLEEFRLAQGIQQSYKEMNQQDKAMLRYNYLLSVTSDAQGDFARTSGSWANQVKVLRLQFDSLKASLGQGFINLFTPILQMINKVLEGMTKLANSFKAFTELITGNKATGGGAAPSVDISDMDASYTDAAESAEDYADATQDVADATTAAKKANDKYLSGLDHIHKYQTVDTGGASQSAAKQKTNTPQSTTPVATPTVDYGQLAQGETAVDKFAQRMADSFKKIQKAAEPTIAALKKLYNEGLKTYANFVWDNLKGFYDHFLVPVGKWVLGEGIPRLVNALNDGIMKVNWGRITKGLNDFWDALAPFAIKVGEGLLWFWEKVLVPLGTWTMNEVVPRFLKTITEAIKALNNILDALKPLWDWFWEKVLEPIAQWTGSVFLKAWDGINKALGTFGNWCKEHPRIIQAVTAAVLAFVAAIKTIAVVKTVLTVLSGLKTALIGLVAGFDPIVLIVAAVIAAGVALIANWKDVKAWCTKVWNGVKDTFTKVWKGIESVCSSVWKGIKAGGEKIWSTISSGLSKTWNGIKTTAQGTFKKIGDTSSGMWQGVKQTVTSKWNDIKGGLSQTWNGVKDVASKSFTAINTQIQNGLKPPNISSTWSQVTDKLTGFASKVSTAYSKMADKVKGAFSKMFSGVVSMIKTPINGIIGMFNKVINGIIWVTNSVIGAINKISIRVPTWVPGIGGRTYGFNLRKIATYDRIPYLAQGAVIPPNAPFTAVLGDQKSGNNIETPEDLLRQIVRDESGGGTIRVPIYLDGKIVYEAVVKEAKARQRITGKNGFSFA